MYSSLNCGGEHSIGATDDTRMRRRNTEAVVEWQREGKKKGLNRKTTCYLTVEMRRATCINDRFRDFNYFIN